MKILAKIVLSRLPVGYEIWRRAGVFVHGRMNSADYALQVLTAHFERFGGREKVAGAVCLELGPGDSLASALVARAYGAARIYLVDVGDFADRNLDTYREIAKALDARGLPAPDLTAVDSVQDMLAALNADYLVGGTASLQTIDSNSVDLIWSEAVLEHVRLTEVDSTFRQLHRILRPGGVMSHTIDFKDHLAGSLNNLRFSRRVWESEFMARSGFYTNRLRYSDMLRRIKSAGFDIHSTDPDRWSDLPLRRGVLSDEFSDMADDDLLIRSAIVVASPIGLG